MALHVSSNAGSSWTTHKITSGEGTGFAVAVGSNNRNLIFVGGNKGNSGALFKSLDGGTNWTEIGKSVFGKEYVYVNDIAIDPLSNNFIYVGNSSGLFKSADGGGTWAKVFPLSVNDILIDPFSTNKIYAAGPNGIFFSTDRGGNWQDMSSGLAVKDILCLDMNAANQTIYAGSNGGSVYLNRELDACTLTITAGEGGTTSPAPGTYFHEVGTEVEIEAIPEASYTFAGWSGSVDSQQNPISITMNSDKTLKANFEIALFPPVNLSGEKIMNRSLLLSQYINVLNWEQNPKNSGIVKYRIYLIEGTSSERLAEVDANTFIYWHKDVDKDGKYTYGICAVNNKNQESVPALITIQ